MMVAVNHLSNVISWENFKGQQYIGKILYAMY